MPACLEREAQMNKIVHGSRGERRFTLETECKSVKKWDHALILLMKSEYNTFLVQNQNICRPASKAKRDF